MRTYDMYARTYRPEIGRFLTEDRLQAAGADLELQADPLTQNRYTFAGGNPVSNIEWDGHYPACNTCTGDERRAIEEGLGPIPNTSGPLQPDYPPVSPSGSGGGSAQPEPPPLPEPIPTPKPLQEKYGETIDDEREQAELSVDLYENPELISEPEECDVDCLFETIAAVGEESGSTLGDAGGDLWEALTNPGCRASSGGQIECDASAEDTGQRAIGLAEGYSSIEIPGIGEVAPVRWAREQLGISIDPDDPDYAISRAQGRLLNIVRNVVRVYTFLKTPQVPQDLPESPYRSEPPLDVPLRP